MQVRVLGAAEATIDGTAVDLGARKQRALLAALALHRGRPVHVDSIVDLIWSDAPPPGVTGTLQSYVAGLRRALEPDRAARAPSSVLVTEAPGYALRVEDDRLDAARFDALIGRAHRELGPINQLGERGDLSVDDLERVLADLDDALALWRGQPYLELEDAPAAVAERARLEELRLLALEDRAVAGLTLGRHAVVSGELEALTASNPLRERLWGLRAVALVRSGRQADALDVLQRVRTVLADELGLEPGPELRALQTAVLRQDPELEWRPAPVSASDGDGAVTNRDRAAAPWPMMGRDDDLRSLEALLRSADARVPSCASIVGEPGIGKSRLAAELAESARVAGATVLVGRCSQDEGAPPLWPWTSVFQGLGRELETETHQEDDGARFRSWDVIVRTLLEEARSRTLVVILDDLHWADPSSLRVLRLLIENAEGARLLVVSTWRDRPEPSGHLAGVAEALARRHALRLHLTGLTTDELSVVVGAVAHSTPSATEAQALLARTDGNPFFLVEYARLAEDRGDLAALLDETNPPSAVSEVLARRVGLLPDDTRRLLPLASVIGRQVDLPTLAQVAGSDPDDVLDSLDAALSAGLLRDDGAESFRFAHALVRDTLYTAIPPTRRARVHGRVAESLEDVPAKETEVARHWLAAGPAHAGRAWRAAVIAADGARRVYAYEEAAVLLRDALTALTQDSAATATDRYDLLLALTEALRLAGDWAAARVVAHDAIAMAETLGDVTLLARAATATSTDAVWQAAAHGVVDDFTVAALRRALDELPAQDSAIRCSVMLALATEIYYGSTSREREALAEEAVAMARRLGEPALLLRACQMAFVSIWRPGTGQQRRLLVEEAVGIAEQLGDEFALTLALTMKAAVASELGDIRTQREVSERARRRAERQRHVYALMLLDTLDVPWLAMAGRFEEAEAALGHLGSLGERITMTQYDQAVAGAMLMLVLWQGRAADVLPAMADMEEASDLPLLSTRLAFMIRAGQLDEARALHAARPIELGTDTWFSSLVWATSAEVAAELGDAALGAEVYHRLAPFAGGVCSGGSAAAIGPVDAFLALAACATGEKELAARHADASIALIRKWDIPLVAAWLQDKRDAHGF
jgi:DNA-binding SARP family transcriptional activator